MVKTIDIEALTIDELSGIVSIYPWFAAARVELCEKLLERGALTDDNLRETALYTASRATLWKLSKDLANKSKITSEKPFTPLAPSILQPATQVGERKVYVVGGDYFSAEQYNENKSSESEGIFAKFAAKARADGYKEDQQEEGKASDFCTETLAQIFLEQDYKEQAIGIYSKLGLRYPEKSIYFATLIDEIKQKSNNK